MKTHDVTQNTDEWMALRMGRPTASAFDKILTSTGKPSTSSRAYAMKLAGELYAGKSLDTWKGNAATERGHELEPEARDTFSFIYDLPVNEVGFITNDLAGCSPDGEINNDGLWEGKCPQSDIHIGYIVGGKVPAKYYPQVQGQLWITGREYCYFMSYHPDLPPFIFKQQRDDVFIKSLEIEIEKLIEKRDGFLESIRQAA